MGTVRTHTEIVEHVVTHRDVTVRPPADVPDRPTATFVSELPLAPASRTDQTVAERTGRKEADVPPVTRQTDVSSATPPPAPSRAEPVRSIGQRLDRRDTRSSIGPRPARQAPARAPSPPKSSRLMIGKLVVEVVRPPAPAPPRQAARPAPSAPRPFRAGALSSLAIGRASGLGQV
jgi:hypothetical protein